MKLKPGTLKECLTQTLLISKSQLVSCQYYLSMTSYLSMLSVAEDPEAKHPNQFLLSHLLQKVLSNFRVTVFKKLLF